MYKECIKHYLSIFDKMNQAELLGYEVEKNLKKHFMILKFLILNSFLIAHLIVNR